MRRLISCLWKAPRDLIESIPLKPNNQQEESLKPSSKNLETETYLSFQSLAQTESTPTEPPKTEKELWQDVNAKHRDYLHKKNIFKEHPADGSPQYQELKKNYLEATHTAWTAINSYREQPHEDEQVEEGVRGYSCKS